MLQTAEMILNRIHQLAGTLALEHNKTPTHVLLDPASLRILQQSAHVHTSLIDAPKKTVFGCPIIEVYKPHPYIAISIIQELLLCVD